MSNIAHSLVDAPPAELRALLDTATETGPTWNTADMQDLFVHQWTAPLEVDLSGLGESASSRIAMLVQAKGLLLRSFGDLLEHPRPPLELLVLAKEFAKRCLGSPHAPIPQEVARALYFATLAAALRGGYRITTLADDDIRQGLQWALARPWLADGARDVLRAGIQALATDRGATS